MKTWTFLQIFTIISLFLLFLGLKLGGAITWAWLWVTTPLWVPLVTLGLIILFAGWYGGLVYLVKVSNTK